MGIELKTKGGNIKLTAPSGGGTSVDLSNYYTKGEVDALIPSLDGYATTEYVDNSVNSVDLSNYATKDELSDKVSSEQLGEATAQFVTEADVIALIEEHGGGTLPKSEEAEF